MRSSTRIVSLLPKQDWIVVSWVLAIKILLFYFGATSYAVFWDQYITSPHQWFEIWDQWVVCRVICPRGMGILIFRNETSTCEIAADHDFIEQQSR